MEIENEEEKEISLFKRKRNDRADSPAESLTTDSGSVVDEAENNEPETETVTPNNTSVPTPNSASSDASPIVPSLPLTSSLQQSFESTPPGNMTPEKVDICTTPSQTPTPVVIINNMGPANFKGINNGNGAPCIPTSVPMVGIKVPIPNLSNLEENGLTKKVCEDSMSSDSKFSPFTALQDDVDKSNGEMLKVEELKHEMKPSEDMMKVMVKEEMESSNDELSNVQMPSGIILKDEMSPAPSVVNIMQHSQNIKLEPGVLREQQQSPLEMPSPPPIQVICI